MSERTELGEVGLTRSTQIAVLRLLNSPAVMGVDVCDGKEAWIVVDQLFKDRRIVLLSEPSDLEQRLRSLTVKIKHSPRMWPDAYLAAFAIAVRRKLVTSDRGFLGYAGLDVELLG